MRIAGIIARSVNFGAWNTDLHVKLTYAELAEKAGVSRATVARALDELQGKPTKRKPDGGTPYISVESLTRGGCRITFQQSHS